ncbi:MAG: hypothetical protein N2313_09835, partial [Meiothermus ruber]|nr:hypothetical protein [Meiothermus ruber]
FIPNTLQPGERVSKLRFFIEPVRGLSPHGLRHTYTSLAFQAGLSPKQVADRLRHADPSLALRIYQHLQEEDRRRAALNLDTLLHLHGEKTGQNGLTSDNVKPQKVTSRKAKFKPAQTG